MRTDTDFYKAEPFYRDERIMRPLGDLALFTGIAAVAVVVSVLGFEVSLRSALLGQVFAVLVILGRVLPDLADGIEAHLAWRRRVAESNRRREERLAVAAYHATTTWR